MSFPSCFNRKFQITKADKTHSRINNKFIRSLTFYQYIGGLVSIQFNQYDKTPIIL